MSAPGDKLFHVIVLGGLALIAHESCGGQTSGTDGGTDATEEFPSELPTFIDANAAETGQDAFPSELPTVIDAGSKD
jgi:hypothetical protein